MNEQMGNFPNPEREPSDYRRRVLELFEVGLSADDIYAYHGTSFEAIDFLAEHGRLPASGIFTSEFYLAPLDLGGEEEQLEQAKHYAAWNAVKFYVLERLPFRPSDMGVFSGAVQMSSESDYKGFLAEAAQHGISEKRFDELVAEAEKTRKGVIVALSQQVRQDFPEREITDDAERLVTVDRGLPIDYITGIEPMGQHEWDELTRMQEESQ